MEQTIKQTRTKHMTEGSPLRLLFLFSLPLMAGNLCQQLYTVVDTAVVGKQLGVDALAALGAVDWLNWLVLSVIQGFAQGFAILMAQQFGAGNYHRLRQVVTNSIVLAVICAIGMTAVGQGCALAVLELLHTPAEIQPVSIAYLRVLFAGTPVVMAYNFCASVLRSLGDGKNPLLAMVIASVVNISLDFLFVMGFGWGVQGAAAATVLAQLISVGFCLMQLKKIAVLHLSKEDWKMERPLMGHLLMLGIPMAFQNMVISVGGMIVQTVINGFGVVFIAGFTATNKLYGLLETAATSYGYAMVTYAGQNLGARRKDRISQGMRAGLFISFVTSLVITVLMLVLGPQILSLFIADSAKNGGEVLAIAYRYLKIMSICLAILYVLHVTRSCIQGMGNTVLPMVSGIAEFVMRTGAALILPRLLGEDGIFYAEILAWLGADLVLVPSYFYMMRKLRRTRE